MLYIRIMNRGVGMGVAKQPWPHQYFNKKGACQFFYFSRSRVGSCRTWAVEIERSK